MSDEHIVVVRHLSKKEAEMLESIITCLDATTDSFDHACVSILSGVTLLFKLKGGQLIREL
jgi:hypothetical protein